MRIIKIDECLESPIYKNTLVKYRNIIFSVSSIIRQDTLSGNYKIINRFYKITSFTNNILFEEVFYILQKKYNQDILKIIIKYYLQDDVSFKPITKANDSNTLKLENEIIFSGKLQLYQTLNDYQDFNNEILNYNTIIKMISSTFSNNFQHLLNNNKCFNIDNIFFIDDNNIDFCNIFEIYNNTHHVTRRMNKGWGIHLKIT